MLRSLWSRTTTTSLSLGGVTNVLTVWPNDVMNVDRATRLQVYVVQHWRKFEPKKTLKSRLILSHLWYFLPNCKNSFEDATMTKEMDTRVRDCRRSGKTVICQICFIFIFLRRQLQTQFKGLLPFVHCAVINFSLSLSRHRKQPYILASANE